MNLEDRLIPIVLLSLLLYSAVSLASSAKELKQAEAIEARLAGELARQQEKTMLLREKLDDGLSDEELAQLARQRLGLVLPGEKIFYFTTDREE